MVNWHPLGTIWHPLEGPGMYISPQKTDLVTCANALPRGHAEHGVSTKPPAQLPGVPPGQAAELPQRKTWMLVKLVKNLQDGPKNPEKNGVKYSNPFFVGGITPAIYLCIMPFTGGYSSISKNGRCPSCGCETHFLTQSFQGRFREIQAVLGLSWSSTLTSMPSSAQPWLTNILGKLPKKIIAKALIDGLDPA